jgi:hypothetical protein
MTPGAIVNVKRNRGRGHRMGCTPARVVAVDRDGSVVVELPIRDASRRLVRQTVSPGEVRRVTPADEARIRVQFEMQENA